MSNQKVYDEILAKVTKMLETGIVPWRKPYTEEGCCARSHISGEPYSFLNQMLLDKPGEYWTFKQVQNEGKRLRKGCHAQQIYFWKLLSSGEADDVVEVEYPSSGGLTITHSVQKEIPMLKRYNVFHEDDVEGIEHKVNEPLVETRSKIDAAEEIVKRYFEREGAPKLEFNNCVPSYSPSKDRVQVPKTVKFETMDDFYDTLFHEMVHSTGIKKRLDRGLDTSTAAFRGASYSKEELVAEMGGAMLSQKCGLSDSLLDNNASYCAGWLTHLKSDPKWIVWAASRSNAAVNFILTGNKLKAE